MEQNIETYFVSKEFKSLFTKFDKNSTSSFIKDFMSGILPIAFTYCQINSISNDNLDTKGLTNILSQIVDRYTSTKYFDNSAYSILLRDFATKHDLGNVDELDFMSKLEMFTILESKLVSQNFAFHAFNSAHLDSIRQNGLNPNVSNSNQAEIDRINDIFVKHGFDGAFGAQKVNCEGKVSYSLTPSVSYHYGQSSPEWFSEFTGGQWHTKDYEKCRKSVLSRIEQYDLSAEEGKQVLQFFDKYWNVYSNGVPVVAVIPQQKLDNFPSESSRLFDEEKINLDSEFRYAAQTYSRFVNLQSNTAIDTSNALFVQMPDVPELMDIVQGRTPVSDIKDAVPTSDSSVAEVTFPTIQENQLEGTETQAEQPIEDMGVETIDGLDGSDNDGM